MPETAVDHAAWLRRWDAQQQSHMPDREERFLAITEALAAFAGETPRVLDLGCGPGSLSARVLDRIPGAEIVAIDTDPVLLAIGRGALGAHPRLHFVDADLRGDWPAALPLAPPFDAAVSTTALHWLGLGELLRFYGVLAACLRPGAVFLDGDRFDFGHDQQTIGRVAAAVHPDWGPAPHGAESWDGWWAAIEASAEFAAEVTARHLRGHDHPHREQPQTYEFHSAALHAAGFAEVGTVWQHTVNRVLIAIR